LDKARDLPLTREPPPPGQHALDTWHREIVCPKCGTSTSESIRLLAAVDAVFCQTCWFRIELEPLKPAIRADEEAAIEIGGPSHDAM
jgi:hypothetical protein